MHGNQQRIISIDCHSIIKHLSYAFYSTFNSFSKNGKVSPLYNESISKSPIYRENAYR
jgi:hypothetical protein